MKMVLGKELKMNIEQYFKHIQEKVKENYAVANKARKKGFDPIEEVEIPIALSLAEKCTGLISTLYPQLRDKKIVDRILELEKEFGSLDPAVALKIAEELAKEKFCKFESHHQAMEAGIRVAISYLTLGVVSSPIEGFVEVKICKTRNGEDYFAPYYSGPIRSAGGTEAAFSLVIIDYLREIFGYARYDPSEDEVKRGIHETHMYHERVSNLQYLPTEEEIEIMMRNVPVQVSGDPSADKEVYNYKDLDRVPTNFIRSGFALVLNEGLALKAPKVLKRINKLKEKGFRLSGWDWLEGFVKRQNEIKEGKNDGEGGAVYIRDLVAGRPVFGHPSESGAFRLRYGRSRTTGFSTLGLHPATMTIFNDFIAVGTQLKIEKPTKGCTIASCTTIDGPIVKFKDGSVKYISDVNEAKEVQKKVVEIIYSGDLLVPYGDFVNRNHVLEKAGYVEQYWLQQLKKVGGESELIPSFEKAKNLSKEFGVPLHPKYIFYWREINSEQFFGFLDWLSNSKIENGKLILPYSEKDKEIFSKGKRGLEILGCSHEVVSENVVVDKSEAESLLFNLGIFGNNLGVEVGEIILKIKGSKEKILDLVNELCEFEIKDKSGTFIGSRMGRPEKAKLRKLTGSPHVLFPVGDEGGRLRSFQSACDVGTVGSVFPLFQCVECGEETVYSRCDKCRGNCKRRNYCATCDKVSDEKCLEHFSNQFRWKKIDIKRYFDGARKIAKVSEDEVAIIKGIRKMSNADHSCEHLSKGFLRAKFNLNVNKDGTIRYDMSEMPLTHFKPFEIGTSVEKLKELGYEKDAYGNVLEKDNQIVEIFPHDVVLPACEESEDELADDVFFKITQFVDAELERIYKLKKYFDFEKKEDLVGVLLGCMAPHNCAAVVGRIIGFSKTQGMLASPYMHAAMRRDCDGDEAAAMLLMDMLINFSKKFLPAHRGGTQDAPLVLNARIKAGEVDDMIFDFDVSKETPLELYEAAENEKSPYDVKMEQVKGRLGGNREFSDLWFEYDTEDLNLGPLCSSYKLLPTMQEKVDCQMDLCKKLRAVDVNDVARLIIERHFIRDTRGNLRKFSMQGFRCSGCGEKYRRPPLIGKCRKCGGKLLFTVAEGSVLKYMDKSLKLAKEYHASKYLLESLELTEMYIESIFGKSEKQESLDGDFGSAI